jgi:hypothetical protein
MKRLLLLLVALAPVACLDFEDPTIPDRRQPVRLNANLRLLPGGIFQIDGTLSPGREQTGVLRLVQVPEIHASEFVATPVERDVRGVHHYLTAFSIAPERAASAFEVLVPAVRGTSAIGPIVLHGLRRLDPDTLRLRAGDDIVLHMDTVAQPSPADRTTAQWFAEIRGGSTVFRIIADGPPPPALRIPADWVAAPTGATVTISLIYYQTTQITTPDDTYVANVLLDTRLQWTVVYEGEP